MQIDVTQHEFHTAQLPNQPDNLQYLTHVPALVFTASCSMLFVCLISMMIAATVTHNFAVSSNHAVNCVINAGDLQSSDATARY